MWQSIDIKSYVDSVLVDSSLVKFNLTAWMGGYLSQDDSVEVTLTFFNSTNQYLDNAIRLGPVLGIDRGGVTSLILQKYTGLVPVGARSLTVIVTITRYSGSWNNGDVDNIGLTFYK